MRARVGLPMVKSRSANMTSTIGDKISYSLVARTFKIEVQQIIRFFIGSNPWKTPRGGLAAGARSPEERCRQYKKRVPLFEDSRRLIIFVLRMYKQLTSEQRSQIFALLQRKCPRKEIARIVGISQSTLSRELKRNSTPSGKYMVHPTFGVMRQSCSAYSLSWKYLSSLNHRPLSSSPLSYCWFLLLSRLIWGSRTTQEYQFYKPWSWQPFSSAAALCSPAPISPNRAWPFRLLVYWAASTSLWVALWGSRLVK